ncbi:MAG: DUF1801 domain-containing protein [Chitinophagaceae bacterium]|nr:DUF1801 domain-containing protein [Chitinophagaceae bacterium]MBK9532399.1 DUF1801 domain-containing protein [Chitinophagaceae bacterium]
MLFLCDFSVNFLLLARVIIMNPENKTADVNAFMKQLDHPLKDAIEAVRDIIKSNPNISERVKWNAPSFFYTDDLATIHVKARQHVHLIFHHPAIVSIQSEFLEGDYKDRRMMYFESMKEVKARKKELTRIIKELVALVKE